MDLLDQEERIREAELYEEIKDLANLKKVLFLKKQIFEERRFKLRGLVLSNLKKLIETQLKALDEEYNLIGLDEECWTDEEYFFHDLEKKIKASNQNQHTKEQKESMIRSFLSTEKIESKQINLLITLVKKYASLLYEEIRKIELENLFEINKLLAEEEKKIREIGKIIQIEEEEEEKVVAKRI